MKKLFGFFLLITGFTLNILAQERGVGVNSMQNQSSEKRLALIIGNSDYKFTARLNNPVNDAGDIAATLKELNFEVISGMNQNRKEMESLIRNFGRRLAETKAVGLFFYAGHGISARGTNYLIPVDADIQEEDEIKYHSVDINFVLSKMEAAKNNLNLLILDACRNNPFERRWRTSRSAEDNGGLLRIDAPTGTLVAYATKPGEVALDAAAGGARNGLYTGILLKYMRVKNLDVVKMFQRVRAEVMKQSGGRQVPFDESSLTGDFYFAGHDTTAVNPGLPPASEFTRTGELAAHYKKGEAYFKKGEYERAVAEFTKALELDSKYEPAYHYRGLAVSFKNEYILAIIDFTKSIELNPKNVYSFIYRGNMLVALKQFDKAIADYSKAIELSPNDVYAYTVRGIAYVSKREFELAKADFDKAIMINPNYETAWDKRGWLHNVKGDYEQAIADYTKHLKLKPDNSWAYDARGWSYLRQRNYDLAILDFNKAIALDSKNAQAYHNRAVAFANKGEYNLAVADYTKAIELAPNDALIYLNRAISYDAVKRTDLAAADRKKAQELKDK